MIHSLYEVTKLCLDHLPAKIFRVATVVLKVVEANAQLLGNLSGGKLRVAVPHKNNGSGIVDLFDFF
ncbi:hypothetical protein D3C86_1848740 [compost metagenome]